MYYNINLYICYSITQLLQMKQLKLELRKWFALKVIDLLNWVLPDGDFKENFSRFLIKNLMML